MAFSVAATYDVSVPAWAQTFLTYICGNWLPSVFSGDNPNGPDLTLGEILFSFGTAPGGSTSNLASTTQAGTNFTPTFSQLRMGILAQDGVGVFPSVDPFSGVVLANRTIYHPLAKSIGLMANNTDPVATIEFNSTLLSSAQTQGQSAPPSGQYDFFATAVHEITEALGRVSVAAVAADHVTAMDYFRFTSGGVPTITATSTASIAYFSLDGGTTLLRSWNNQVGNGDVGDWFGSGAPGVDAFNDFATPSVNEPVSQTDLKLMNAIGFSLTRLGKRVAGIPGGSVVQL